MVASRPFIDLLTNQREKFQQDVLARLNKHCADYQLGIAFDGFSLHDLHPPQKVVRAYYEVAKAMEEYDTRKMEAQTAALKLGQEAKTEYDDKIRQTDAANAVLLHKAEADARAFLHWVEIRKTLTAEQERICWQAFVDDLRAGKPLVQALEDYHKNRVGLIALQANVAKTLLYLDTFTKAVGGRELTLLDLHHNLGRRVLMLVDPDLLRMPLPIFMQPDGTRGPLKTGPKDHD
jgi:hypothetical protein